MSNDNEKILDKDFTSNIISSGDVNKNQKKIMTNAKKQSNIGNKLPMLFVRNIVLFPNSLTPLFVGRDKSINALNYAFKNNLDIVISTQKKETNDIAISNVFYVGVIARIVHVSKTSENNIRVLVESFSRIKINTIIPSSEQISSNNDFFFADFKYIKPIKLKAQETKLEALKNKLLKSLTELSKVSTKISTEVLNTALGIKDIATLHYVLISSLDVDIKKKQRILESNNLERNLLEILELVSYELEVVRYERQINEDVKKKLQKDQKKYYLYEQKKIIEDELDKLNPNDEKSEYGKYIALSKKNKLPLYAFKKVEEEITKLKSSSNMSSEAGIIKNYLDFLIALPWYKKTDYSINLTDAQNILNKWHFGLNKVKDRILEYIAIQSRSLKPKGQILCLYGPPGVGKTSLAKSIAEAMNIKYAKISLGGLRDEAEIRGHRKTYIGAFGGKILNALKSCEVINPLILLDEIDKIGTNYKGDVTSALLEVLDPEQNTKFNDHYLEIPYDLSNVTFIATANSLDMPQPLLDRMEIIHVTGYTENEKLKICQNYILPKVFQDTEIRDQELKIEENSIIDIIRYYTKESGVRGLSREIQKICGKVIKDIISNTNHETANIVEKSSKIKNNKKNQTTQNKTIVITNKNLHQYLGIKKYNFGLMEKEDQIGVVTGLAYTSSGGDILKIEAIKIPSDGKSELKTTGKLGEVIKESVQTAFSYAQMIAKDFKIKPDEFKKYSVHIHFPEGAVPKDGPSAGCAIAIAILSLFSEKKVKKDIGMTGEITLTGKVLPIGGLKEKLTAALRSGLKTVFIPLENKKDLEDVPEEIKKLLNIIPVSSLFEIANRSLV